MKPLQTALVLAALAVPFGATASESLYLQVPVRLAPGAFVPQSVKNECELERHLADEASTQLTKEYGRLELAGPRDDVGNDKVIKITIINAWGAGGGGWSGPKSLQVLAELKQGDVTMSSALFRRTTNVSGLFQGTCAMFNKITRVLGKDVAEWMRDGAPSQPGALEAAAEPARKPAE